MLQQYNIFVIPKIKNRNTLLEIITVCSLSEMFTTIKSVVFNKTQLNVSTGAAVGQTI